jgi:cytochrome c-type biogenesis protein
MATENISYVVAFVAGLLTFLSPCLLPLIPSFIAYITGISFGDLKNEKKRGEVRAQTIIHSLLFIAGFSLVFILLGLTATALGRALFQFQDIIRMAGGVLIIIFGLFLTGVVKMDFLIKEHHLHMKFKGATYFGSFLVGVTFAAAWTPCAGPILGSILVLAGTQSSMAHGAALLVVYSLGIAIPFFITGLIINTFLEAFNKFKKVIGGIQVAGGVLLIIVGILMITNYLPVMSGKLLTLFSKH